MSEHRVDREIVVMYRDMLKHQQIAIRKLRRALFTMCGLSALQIILYFADRMSILY